MKTTVRIALLVTLTIATACRFVADKKDDAVGFLAAAVLGSVAELQSATPLEQSSFRDAEPVAPKKESKTPAQTIRAPKKADKAVSLVAERRVRAPRRMTRLVRVAVPPVTDHVLCNESKQLIVVVPMADTIGS